MIWSKTWTVVFRCYRCARKFTIRHVTFDRVWALYAIYPCPFCSARPALVSPPRNEAIKAHMLVELNSDEPVYRKYPESETWHFTTECSQWPSENFLVLEVEPTAAVCNECRAKAGTGAPGE